MTHDNARPVSPRFHADAAGRKVLTLDQARRVRRRLKRTRARLVFTNGCFDLIHPGHVAFLQHSRSLGEALLVGLNSDDSVRRIKGRGRPILSVEERIGVLAGLEAVDYICVFEEDTPHNVLRALLPDILVKGGDYSPDQIVAREVVENAGGRAATVSTAFDTSTTAVIKRILEADLSPGPSPKRGGETDAVRRRARFDRLIANSLRKVHASTSPYMKILHTIYDDVDNPWCGGGGAVRALEINRRLAHNHDITLLTGNFPGAALEEDRYGIRIRRAGTNRNYALSRLSFSALASRALAGWPFDLWVYDFSAFSPVFALPSRQARSVMVFHHPIAAHATRKYPGIGLLAAAAECLHTRLQRRIIAVSPSTALHLRRRARPNTTIHTICNGVNHPQIAETREEDYILFFGRLDTYNKGIDVLLPAFARLRPAHPDVRLVLGGRGTDARLKELRSISRSLGISDRVELTGPVSETEKWDLYAGALFTCQPSRYEGWGITAIESGAAGKAVIGTEIPGLADAIQRDRTGLLVPAENPEALAGAMKHLLENPQRRADLGRNGREWAANFSWDRIAREQERVYVGSLA